MQTEFTRELIERAFDGMGALAAARGITIEIAVYGGSCLILASDIRNASGDVDAVFLVGGKAVREIADAVGAPGSARRLDQRGGEAYGATSGRSPAEPDAVG